MIKLNILAMGEKKLVEEMDCQPISGWVSGEVVFDIFKSLGSGGIIHYYKLTNKSFTYGPDPASTLLIGYTSKTPQQPFCSRYKRKWKKKLRIK